MFSVAEADIRARFPTRLLQVRILPDLSCIIYNGTVKLIGLSNLTVNQILRGEVRVLTGPPNQRGIAQPGSALVWGTSGRRFESGYPDHIQREVAQVGERGVRDAEVAGSIPVFPTSL